MTRDPRVPYVAAAIFLFANWVGQDYYSPQATAYLLALAYMVVLLRYFREPPVAVEGGGLRRRWRRLIAFAPDEPPHHAVNPRSRAVLLALMLAMFTAIVVSHQLTPAILIVSTVAIVLVRRTSLRTLPWVLLAIFFTWISFGAFSYWSGHLSELFGGIGQLGTSVNQNLGNRVSGNPSRIFVQHVRIALTLGVLGLAGVGVLRRLRAGRGDLTLILLTLAPFSVLGAQSYGGEALLARRVLQLAVRRDPGVVCLVPAPGPRREVAPALAAPRARARPLAAVRASRATATKHGTWRPPPSTARSPTSTTMRRTEPP